MSTSVVITTRAAKNRQPSRQPCPLKPNIFFHNFIDSSFSLSLNIHSPTRPLPLINMADTAPSTPLPELQDSPATLKAKALTLSTLIKESKHLIAFTGAGISTSAGIPDFRGPEGAWTLRAQGRERKGETTSTLQAIPTKAHMALVELQHRGILKYLVSQNCDGLHRRSGILPVSFCFGDFSFLATG